MAPKAEDNYDAEAIKSSEIPNDQVMEDAGKVHLGKFFDGDQNSLRVIINIIIIIEKDTFNSSQIAFLLRYRSVSSLGQRSRGGREAHRLDPLGRRDDEL